MNNTECNSIIWLIFRLLLSQGWKDLEGHVTRRRGSRSWNFVEKHIVPKLISITDENQNCIFTQDEIHLAAGVLDTNSFELNHDNKVGEYLRRPKAPCNSRLYLQFGRCLFLKSAMFNNHCVPNCVRRVVSGTIEIIAVRWLLRGHCFCFQTIIKTSLHQGDCTRRGVVYLLRGHPAADIYQTRNISNHQAFWVPLRQMQVAIKTVLDWSR